ncbi:MAG: nitrogenase component 1 [Anaerotruncus sp.]|nr:nitrogenase component 1 [Anaerotruncus sp.]
MRNFEQISAQFGVNTLDLNLPLPIGVANTEEWLISIAKELGNIVNAKEFLEKEQKFITSQLRFNYNFSWMSTLMYGKYCSILGHAKFGAS